MGEILELGESEFQLEAVIAASTSNVVYRGKGGRGLPVAVKIPKNEEARQRQQWDAYWTERFEHENLTSYVTSGVGRLGRASTHALVSIDAGPNLLQHGPLGLSEAVLMASQIAEALDYVHDEEVVHRKVTPHNIMSVDGKRWQLGNFGVATSITNAQRTAPSTDPYVAPETYQNGATPRSDVYSLALSTWTAIQPENGQELPQTEAHEAVSQVIYYATHEDPTMRPPTAGYFARGLLEEYMAGLERCIQRASRRATDLAAQKY